MGRPLPQPHTLHLEGLGVEQERMLGSSCARGCSAELHCLGTERGGATHEHADGEVGVEDGDLLEQPGEVRALAHLCVEGLAIARGVALAPRHKKLHLEVGGVLGDFFQLTVEPRELPRVAHRPHEVHRLELVGELALGVQGLRDGHHRRASNPRAKQHEHPLVLKYRHAEDAVSRGHPDLCEGAVLGVLNKPIGPVVVRADVHGDILFLRRRREGERVPLDPTHGCSTRKEHILPCLVLKVLRARKGDFDDVTREAITLTEGGLPRLEDLEANIDSEENHGDHNRGDESTSRVMHYCEDAIEEEEEPMRDLEELVKLAADESEGEEGEEQEHPRGEEARQVGAVVESVLLHRRPARDGHQVPVGIFDQLHAHVQEPAAPAQHPPAVIIYVAVVE
mmetsp:Transcript_2822/g.9553  ORF Transcript_2822/g.9553 Transcript_2822/m.9553 type:complete len:395 (+) Transcript_2822:84-1268(+)